MSTASVLCLVFDLNFLSWPSASGIICSIKALSPFVNLFLTQDQAHSVAFYFTYNSTSALVWSSQGRLHFPMELILDKAQELLHEQGSSFRSGLSSGISKSLCYLNRFRVDNPINKVEGRLLVVTPGSHHSDFYISLMNAAFCSHKMVFS
jgi:hypothetical protein